MSYQIPWTFPSKLHPDDHSPFLRLPQELRDIIYGYVLAVNKGHKIWGISYGIICLADRPGYSPKLVNLDYFHNGYEYCDDYLTQDSEYFAPFISRTEETWRIEINQLKYVCKQLRYETRGITLRINDGAKLVFHGTKTSADSSMIGAMFNSTGRISGKANFVHFWTQCSPRWRKHVRDVDIIELPLNDEQPRTFRTHNTLDDNNDPRTLIELVLALELRKAFLRKPISPTQAIEKRAFQRRCAEITGSGGDSSKSVYKICQTNPSLRVIVRYNEWQDSVDEKWIKRMCSYRMALRKGDVGIAMRPQEKRLVHELVSRNGGRARAPSLNNLRMSSSVNIAFLDSSPRYYFLDIPSMDIALGHLKQRMRDIELLFKEGV